MKRLGKEPKVHNFKLTVAGEAALEIESDGSNAMAKLGEELVPLYNETGNIRFLKKGLKKGDAEILGQEGKFCVTIGEGENAVLVDDLATELNLLVIGIAGFSRVQFPPYNSGDTDPVCRSNDGILPSLRVVDPISNQCANWGWGNFPSQKAICPHAQWGEGDVPPLCTGSTHILFMDVVTMQPLVYKMSGRDLTAFRKAVTAMGALSAKTAIKRRRHPKKVFPNVSDYHFNLKIVKNEDTSNDIKFDLIVTSVPAKPGTYDAWGPLVAHYRNEYSIPIGTPVEELRAEALAVQQEYESSIENEGDGTGIVPVPTEEENSQMQAEGTGTSGFDI